jgi:phage tail sheath gpL-like
MAITFYQATGGPQPKIECELYLQDSGGLPSQLAAKDIYVFGEFKSGTAADGSVTTLPFGSVAEALAFFGLKSFGGHMAASIFNYRNSITGQPKGSVYGIAVAEPGGGTAATVNLTFATAASAAGTWQFLIGGHLVSLTVASGDAAADQATALIAVFEALQVHEKPPMTASSGGAGIVTFTAWNKGVTGNTIAVSTYKDPGVTTTASWASAAPVNGAGNPTLTTALAAALPVKTPVIVCPWDDNTTLELIVDHANAKAAAGPQLACAVIVADIDSASNLATAAGNLDDDDGQRVLYAGVAGGVNWQGEQAALVAATYASEPNLGRSLNGLSVPGLWPPAVASRFTSAQITTLLNNGVTPLYVPVGSDYVCISRAVTIRTNLGVMDFARLPVADYVRDYIVAKMAATYPRCSIIDDDLIETTAEYVVGKTAVKNSIYGWFKEIEETGMIYNVDTNWASVALELDTTTGTISFEIPESMMPQNHNTKIRLDVAV